MHLSFGGHFLVTVLTTTLVDRIDHFGAPREGAFIVVVAGTQRCDLSIPATAILRTHSHKSSIGATSRGQWFWLAEAVIAFWRRE
jgi:hypothetical protein